MTEIDGPRTYRDREGDPISVQRWATLWSDTDYRVLRTTAVDEHQSVTTIWNGIPDYYVGLFSTAIRTTTAGLREVAQWETEADALVGHEQFVKTLHAIHGPTRPAP